VKKLHSSSKVVTSEHSTKNNFTVMISNMIVNFSISMRREETLSNGSKMLKVLVPSDSATRIVSNIQILVSIIMAIVTTLAK